MQHTKGSSERFALFRGSLQLGAVCLLFMIMGSCVIPKQDTSATQPAPPPPTFERAVDSYYHGSYAESISILQRLAALQPSAARPRWELVHLYEETGNYEGAIQQLRILLRDNPDGTKIENELFVSLVLAGDYATAESMLPLAGASYKTIFYEALLSMDTGSDSKAKALFEQSLQMHKHQPMAWYFLGKIADAAGDYHAAEVDFQTVRSQNGNLTIAIPPLARAVLAQGQEMRAYPLLMTAHNILPENATIQEEITRLRHKYPQLVKARSAANLERQRDTTPPTVTTFPPATETRPLIRVGLGEHLHSVTIKTGGSYSIRGLSPGSALTYRGEKDEILTLKSSSSGISLSMPGKAPFLTWTAPVTLRYTSRADTTVVFNLVTNAGNFYATSGDRAYRGEMIFRPGTKGFTLVNRLPIEEYLYSVLPSEMYSFWPMAALEAQAVAARSYTLASRNAFSSRGFDVYGSVQSAAYTGVGNETAATTRAVNETQGQILEYDGKPLRAFFSANSGGYSDNSTIAWGESDGMKAVAGVLTKQRTHYLSLTGLYAWLHTDPASYSATPPYFSPNSYRWVKWVPAADIERRANRIKDIGKLLSIITRGRGISGRVAKVELFGTRASLNLEGDSIRTVLGGLRSTLFVYRPKLGSHGFPQYFIFTGGGWGHGVGMDQDGAAGMASAGYTYQQILAHYYPLARLASYSPGPRTVR